MIIGTPGKLKEIFDLSDFASIFYLRNFEVLILGKKGEGEGRRGKAREGEGRRGTAPSRGVWERENHKRGRRGGRRGDSGERRVHASISSLSVLVLFVLTRSRTPPMLLERVFINYLWIIAFLAPIVVIVGIILLIVIILITERMIINPPSFIFRADEADRLMESEYKDDILKVIEKFPKQRRTCLFSATLNSQQLTDFIKLGMRNPVTVSVKVAFP